MTPTSRPGLGRSANLRPPMVTPGAAVSAPAPSDAVVLLGPGADLSEWQAEGGATPTWPIADGVLQPKWYVGGETEVLGASMEETRAFAMKALERRLKVIGLAPVA